MAITPAQIIERKRDGKVLSTGEIWTLITGFGKGSVTDYQMSAFAMAVLFQGMNTRETADLTTAMADSGERFSFPLDAPPRVDKHSTGGVGDKISLILAPLLACDQLWVPMISGRGLGITGGTLDKLESIPGFRVALSLDDALAQLSRIGIVMMGQTKDICPVDRKLYALRDVTATVPSIPLIVSSIMSKKIAESLDRLVVDVKFGSGAFMKSRGEAESLARALGEVARRVGLDFHTRLTPMNQPLGQTIGNSLEVREAVDVLRGSGPPDVRALVLELAETVAESPRNQLESWLDSGTAWQKFQSMVDAQGGDAASLEFIGRTHEPAPIIADVPARRSGSINRVDAETLGRAALALGAGRKKASDKIDPAVGFDRIAKTGDTITEGEPLLRIHARSSEDIAAAAIAAHEAVDIT